MLLNQSLRFAILKLNFVDQFIPKGIPVKEKGIQGKNVTSDNPNVAPLGKRKVRELGNVSVQALWKQGSEEVVEEEVEEEEQEQENENNNDFHEGRKLLMEKMERERKLEVEKSDEIKKLLMEKNEIKTLLMEKMEHERKLQQLKMEKDDQIQKEEDEKWKKEVEREQKLERERLDRSRSRDKDYRDSYRSEKWNPRGSNGKIRTCYTCDSKMHLDPKCPLNKGEKNELDSRGRVVTCHKCCSEWHQEEECPHKFNKNPIGSNGKV